MTPTPSAHDGEVHWMGCGTTSNIQDAMGRPGPTIIVTTTVLANPQIFLAAAIHHLTSSVSHPNNGRLMPMHQPR
eukprot:CAMPEP_0202014944 /NCGR_PEP_ID=MMETSP0905-20130828/30594_1 /ASSEMBLY_ACC=CAM_ASM_000554 /TAXON_ID=420261 /ORGANISM="Thalassiosira antarctica, Strain CCMP982" /LENGTH=74 /DNA_ID=CAMNT_0048574987 /DNA_START=132 /DNA_END=357 /DNA_ORIENTATION=+